MNRQPTQAEVNAAIAILAAAARHDPDFEATLTEIVEEHDDLGGEVTLDHRLATAWLEQL